MSKLIEELTKKYHMFCHPFIRPRIVRVHAKVVEGTQNVSKSSKALLSNVVGKGHQRNLHSNAKFLIAKYVEPFLIHTPRSTNRSSSLR